MYICHGGPNHQAWWYQNMNDKKLPLHIPNGKLKYVDVNKTKLEVYVKVVHQDIDKLRNDYLVYMGSQKHIICRDHQLPLIASSKRENNCTYYNLPTDKISRKN